ncbi:MAG: VUT family protein [Lachnospiraceae bacterium]|nr:VUT family protein [Lachnospiraceae bacterium]
MSFIKRELKDYKALLRSIPSLNITLFVVSVIAMNLLANKELFSTPWLALDCGFTLSWISFLCMDMICKHFGPKPAVKISILALAINLLVCGLFKLMSMTPGMWGEYYSTEMVEVNDALNATFGGSWYVVLGSSTAMLVSALVNAVINALIGKKLTNDSFKTFAARSYISTFIAQFVDNLIFATMVSYVFFGWSLTQVLTCSLTGALAELLFEVILSPLGYKIVKGWKKDRVGSDYLQRTE